MYSFLLSNGCSFLTKRVGVNNHTGVLLAKKFSLDHIGLAQAGKGNDRLILTTKLFFYENPERIEDTFVLVGWTNPARIDYIDNYREDWICSGDWGEYWFSLKKKPAKQPTWDTYKQTQNYGNLVAKLLRQILELQDFFENLGVNYCMYHALSMLPHNITVKFEKLELLREKINHRKFYKFNEESQQFFINYDRPKYTVSKKDLHPNTEGHLAWYKKIEKFIEENKLA